MLRVIAATLAALLSACSTISVTPVSNGHAGYVAVLYSPPSRPYDVVGVVTAKRYKPGWTDPTTADAIPQLQAAGAQVGADAVIVKDSVARGDRNIIVDGEAIRYR